MNQQKLFHVFTGSSNPSFAKNIASRLKLSLGKTIVSQFSDGESRVEILEHVRGDKVYIIQSVCDPTNNTLLELLLLADALKRSSAKKVVAVVPYLGYSRQDRRPGYSRVPISARLIADMIQVAGVDHLLTVDLHATQIQGFYKIPVDNISAIPLFVGDIYKRWVWEDPVIVSPDVGGVMRARSVAKELGNVELAIVDKRRPKANSSEIMNIIGEVKEKTCILIDDIVDTAGTLGKAANALIEKGAKQVVAYCTHPVLSGPALENINNSTLSQLIVTDTIPLKSAFRKCKKVVLLSMAEVIAETITRMNNKESISTILD